MADGMTAEAILAVVVVLDDPGVVALGDLQELEVDFHFGITSPSGHWQDGVTKIRRGGGLAVCRCPIRLGRTGSGAALPPALRKAL